MPNRASYTIYSNGFIIKVENIDITNDVPLVTTDVVGLYSGILLEIYLKALRNTLEMEITRKYQLKTLRR